MPLFIYLGRHNCSKFAIYMAYTYDKASHTVAPFSIATQRHKCCEVVRYCNSISLVHNLGSVGSQGSVCYNNYYSKKEREDCPYLYKRFVYDMEGD